MKINKKSKRYYLEIKSLLIPLQKIKFMKRNGWVKRGVNSESIAAHTLDATFIGWYLAKIKKLKENKIIKMLLIHDLVMAFMNDLTPADKAYRKKSEIEEKAFNRVMENIPSLFKQEYSSLWKEFQKQNTKEAKVAKEADKLATLFQGEAYEEETNIDIISEHLSYYASVFTSREARKIYKTLKRNHLSRLKKEKNKISKES